MPKHTLARWTPNEDGFLKANYRAIPVSALAKRLKRSPKATRTRLERLGYRLASLPRNSPKPKIIRRKYLGWHMDGYGRKIISVKGRGPVAHHRLIIEQEVGRRLLRTEHVHHINGDKQDNRIGNLHLFPDAGGHMACHRSLEAVIAVLLDRGIVEFNRNKGRYELCKTQ